MDDWFRVVVRLLGRHGNSLKNSQQRRARDLALVVVATATIRTTAMTRCRSSSAIAVGRPRACFVCRRHVTSRKQRMLTVSAGSWCEYFVYLAYPAYYRTLHRCKSDVSTLVSRRESRLIRTGTPYTFQQQISPLSPDFRRLCGAFSSVQQLHSYAYLDPRCSRHSRAIIQ